MLASRERDRYDGSRVAVAFGTEKTGDGLSVGVLIVNARCPSVITLEGTQYRVPSHLLSNTDPQIGSHLLLPEETHEHETEEGST